MIRLIVGDFPSFLFLTIAATISQPTISQPTNPSIAQASRNAVAPQASPQPSLPITEVHLWVAPQASPWEMGRLTVPDIDTTIVTQPGSPLRNYDRHIARLFETTYQQCEQKPALKGMNWQYEAANGNISMGEFRLSCRTAREVVSGYHLTQSDRQTTKTESLMNGSVQVSSADIPKLHITGNKADRWLKYVQTIPAVFSPAQRRLEQMQAFPNDRILQSQGIPTVALRIPRAVPKVMKVADRFVVRGTPEGYQLCPATVKGDCDRSSRAQVFQQLTARKGLDFYNPKTLSPGAVYRPIQLAQGIPGIYLENCIGPRCLSIVQWKQAGVLYEIQAQYREQPVLVKIANSTIEAQPLAKPPVTAIEVPLTNRPDRNAAARRSMSSLNVDGLSRL
jgi:hypothetical protein